jgi:U3 small nucleolar RNA-associated protein 14
MDKIYTFSNTEETRKVAIKTLESLLNSYQGTSLGHTLPLFVMPTLFTETDMNKVLERLHFINKVLAGSLRKLRKAKHLPKKRKTTYKTIRKNCAKRNR